MAVAAEYPVTNTGGSAVPGRGRRILCLRWRRATGLCCRSRFTSLRLEGSGGGRLGNGGDRWAGPRQADRGGETDLSLAEAPESGIGDKLFAGPLGVEENWCALERPKAGCEDSRRALTRAATPYLGLWICYGGWPDRPGTKQTCVALEPATAPVDSLAETGPWSRTLAPGESFSWPMIVEIETMTRGLTDMHDADFSARCTLPAFEAGRLFLLRRAA